jgi:hypothetical protein
MISPIRTKYIATATRMRRIPMTWGSRGHNMASVLRPHLLLGGSPCSQSYSNPEDFATGSSHEQIANLEGVWATVCRGSIEGLPSTSEREGGK